MNRLLNKALSLLALSTPAWGAEPATSSATPAAAAPATTPTSAPSDYQYATQPEGKTLPAGVGRLRLPYAWQTGKKGFDQDGEKTDNNLSVRGGGGAVVLEYGLTSKLSLQFLTKYVTNQKIEVDGAGFPTNGLLRQAKTQAYATTFKGLGADTSPENVKSRLAAAAAQILASKGACDPATCYQQIISGELKAPVDLNAANTKLPLLDIKAGSSIGDGLDAYVAGIDAQIESKIVEAAEKKGATGLGDTEIGALYEVYAEKPLFFSVGLGMRLPTGRCDDLSATELPTGRCVPELGLRHNLDLLPFDALMISWQNQAEVAVAKGRASQLGRNVTAERKGVRQVGFVYVKPGLGVLAPSLSVLAPKAGVLYDYDSELIKDDVGGTRSRLFSWMAGLGLDFTRYGLPVQYDLEYAVPFAGKNRTIAPTTLTSTLKLYARF